VEIFYNGSWGTVCDDYFGDVEARVVCFSLGFGLVLFAMQCTCTGWPKKVSHYQVSSLNRIKNRHTF